MKESFTLTDSPDQTTALDRWVAKFDTRDEMAEAYCRVMRERGVSWSGYPALNLAIIDRWSKSGLVYIKERAWKLLAT